MNTGASVKRPLGASTLFVLDLLFGVAWAGVGVLCAWTIPGGLRWIFALVCLILAGICFAAAVGVIRYSPMGRGLNILLAILSLIFFPFGTILGALMLHFLFSSPVKLLFGDRHPTTLSQEERQGLPESNAGLALLIAAPLLGLVAPFFLGIVAAIAIPNFLNAVDRGKQKRSMIDLRTLAESVEGYAADYESYPQADDIHGLNEILVPMYLSNPLKVDGWSREFQVILSKDGYVLFSLGKDGERQVRPPGGPTESFEDDLIIRDGEIYQEPGSLRVN